MAVLKLLMVFVVAPLTCVAACLVLEAVLSCIAATLYSAWLSIRRLYSQRKDYE